MAIVDTIQAYQFRDWLRTSDSYKDYFSYDGANALFQALEELSEDSDIEFDPVAWCCEFSEYADFDDFKENAGYDDIKTLEELREHTLVISESPLVIQDF